MSFELPPEQAGAAAWYGPEISKRSDWMVPLAAADVAEVEKAARALVERNVDIAAITARDFPLPTLR
ncbi:MAG: TauD/TfdA family dioxygenase, partial [Reyranella sp.]|nr:TauD/TfdA family dioxygenase [Reyranella sp.]